jgi:hypothetical protein
MDSFVRLKHPGWYRKMAQWLWVIVKTQVWIPRVYLKLSRCGQLLVIPGHGKWTQPASVRDYVLVYKMEDGGRHLSSTSGFHTHVHKITTALITHHICVYIHTYIHKRKNIHAKEYLIWQMTLKHNKTILSSTTCCHEVLIWLKPSSNSKQRLTSELQHSLNQKQDHWLE